MPERTVSRLNARKLNDEAWRLPKTFIRAANLGGIIKASQLGETGVKKRPDRKTGLAS